MKHSIFQYDFHIQRWGKYKLISPTFEHVIDLINWEKENKEK